MTTLPTTAVANTTPKILLHFDNYFEWATTTSKDLTSAGAIKHIQHNVVIPAGAPGERQRKKKELAHKLIVDSLSLPIWQKYSDIAGQDNPKALWDAIKEGEGTVIQGGIELQNIWDAFHALKFIPSTMTLSDYVGKLNEFKLKLTGDANPLTDDHIRNKLLNSLPKAGLWPAIAMNIQGKGLDLANTVRSLKAEMEQWKEQLEPVTAAEPSANYANGRYKKNWSY